MTARRPATASALLGAIALAAGCGMLPHAPIPQPESGTWPQERDAATRRADIYDGFEHRADVWTIRLTPAVREERARRVAAWQDWTAAELEAKLGHERAEAAKWDDFIVFLYTADKKWNDLDAVESVWRMVFDMGGGEEVRGKAESIARDATFDALFPMGGPFDVVYRVRFPRFDPEPFPRPGVLRLASALGELRLPYTPGSLPVPAPRPAD
jgi:hypothetical protein